MYRLFFIAILIFSSDVCIAQVFITTNDAVERAINNQRNTRPATLNIQQQEQLLQGAAIIDNPQLQVEASPYEGLVVGVQQTFSMPGVYRNRRALQSERINLARLQLQGSQYELKRTVRLSYFQLQYLTARFRLLNYQDSIYRSIKTASQRFFQAGQINKLEELQAVSQSDRVSNELTRVQAELDAERQLLGFYLNVADTIIAEPIETFWLTVTTDTINNTLQQQILQQQTIIAERQLQLERSEVLPQFTAGLLFPTTKDYERPVGYQVGVTIPIWNKQNRSRINAAQTGIEIARAEQELERFRLNANYRQLVTNMQKELRSMEYYNNTALPQARAIIETSQRLFQAGELNYIESLRNLQMAFDIYNDHLETHRTYNESVIQLNYLNQTL